MCFFSLSGSTVLNKTNTLEKYGTLWQDTSLTCKEDTITHATTDITFQKNGQSFILNGIGSHPTKYIVSINVGSIELIIKNTSTSDEGEYRCSIDFIQESPPYDLRVEGKCLFVPFSL